MNCKNMKRKLMLLLMVFLVQIPVVLAQDGGQPIEGTDSFEYQTDDEGRSCYIYGNYVFITVPTEYNGFHINVYKRTGNNSSGTVSPRNVCQNSRRNPYMVLKDSDDQFFSGLLGDKLFIDGGTGPDSRDLKIIDLKSKKTIYSVEAHEVGKVTGKRFLTYFEFSNNKRPLKECLKAREWRKSGFSIGWIQQVRLDVQTMKKTSIGKVSCTALQ